MATNIRSASATTTVVPVLRDDGTTYFRYVGKTVGERICEWALISLWLLVGGVTIATLLV